MPITSPREFSSGPPELPGFTAASVWMIPLIIRPFLARSERSRALTIPVVSVRSSPNGLPSASTFWPTRSCDESPIAHREEPRRRDLDADHGDVVRGVGADDPRLVRRAVEKRDLDRLGPLDDVVIGEDVPPRRR